MGVRGNRIYPVANAVKHISRYLKLKGLQETGLMS
jgi:hypothetical protein